MGQIYSLAEAMAETNPQKRHWLYNSLDCTGTREIFDTLAPRLDSVTRTTYGFEKALQAPALACMRRGTRVDVVARNAAVKELEQELAKDQASIGNMDAVSGIWDATELVSGVCPKGKDGKLSHHKWPRGVGDSPDKKCERCGQPRVVRATFNPGSHVQCKHLFYDLLDCTTFKNKDGKVSTDDDCLEKIGRKYPQHLPIVEAIQACRDKTKQLGSLAAKLSPNNRYHSSFNVAAAWTGRFSSSQNPFGWGGNAQNITERHRHILIADPGFEACYADLKQAESLEVAYLSEDPKYIEAHLSGDTHTYVARLVWPEMAWTGDIKQDKKLAKETLPSWDPVAGHDVRFQSKRIQHGSNYGLTPQGIAMIAHIPLAVAATAQRNYFGEFPYIKAWQDATRAEVQAQAPLTNPLGRRATLFGRPWDDHTYKQGLAYRPQSGVADALDAAFWRVWQECDPAFIQLLSQVHDAIGCQWRVEDRLRALEALARLMTIPMDINGRRMVIPVEVSVGQNFGHFNDNPKHGPLNLGGLKEVAI